MARQDDPFDDFLRVFGDLFGTPKKRRKPRRRVARSTWQATERAACTSRGMKHVGGPGQPDCRGGNHIVEVKDWQRPVGPKVVEQVWQRQLREGASRATLVAPNGFTEGAKGVAKLFGVKLSRR